MARLRNWLKKLARRVLADELKAYEVRIVELSDQLGHARVAATRAQQREQEAIARLRTREGWARFLEAHCGPDFVRHMGEVHFVPKTDDDLRTLYSEELRRREVQRAGVRALERAVRGILDGPHVSFQFSVETSPESRQKFARASIFVDRAQYHEMMELR